MSVQILDAHQHFWKFDPVRDDWITEEMKMIRRDFLPEDLFSELESSNIIGTVAVQADQSEEETEFLLSLAQENHFVKGVVGWLDLRAPDFSKRLDKYATNPYLKGLRHIIQAEEPGFMSNRAFINGLKILGDTGLTYDILIYPHQLAEATEMVRSLPNQRFVLDHLAKPYIADMKMDIWKE